MIDIDFNLNQKKYHSIRSTVEVLFIAGFIIDFLFRRDVLPIEYRGLGLSIFITNLILIAVAIGYIRNLKELEGHKKRVTNTIVKALLNVVFIVAIIFTLGKI